MTTMTLTKMVRIINTGKKPMDQNPIRAKMASPAIRPRAARPSMLMVWVESKMANKMEKTPILV